MTIGELPSVHSKTMGERPTITVNPIFGNEDTYELIIAHKWANERHENYPTK